MSTRHTLSELQVTVTPEQFVASLPAEELNALAALEPREDEFNELVFTHFPPERRAWALRSGLVSESEQLTSAGQPKLALTDHGRRVIELAGERCPEPYADVSFEELLAHTNRTVEKLMADSPVELVPPEEQVYLPQKIGALFRSALSRSDSDKPAHT